MRFAQLASWQNLRLARLARLALRQNLRYARLALWQNFRYAHLPAFLLPPLFFQLFLSSFQFLFQAFLFNAAISKQAPVPTSAR